MAARWREIADAMGDLTMNPNATTEKSGLAGLIRRVWQCDASHRVQEHFPTQLEAMV